MLANLPGDLAKALDSLARGAQKHGLKLSDDQLTCFQRYLETLLLWSQRLSLTGANTASEMVEAHILDSLHAARFVQPMDRIVDLGSGAGFPGIPLAIVCRSASVTLAESRRKRANFLRAVVRAAGLSNVEVYEGRAEALPNEPLYDVTVSRAVWTLAEFLTLSSRLLKQYGLAIAMKGTKSLGEAEQPTLGFHPPEIAQYTLQSGVCHVVVAYRMRDVSRETLPPSGHV